MPRLESGLIVLEDNFYEIMKDSSYDRGVENCRARRRMMVMMMMKEKEIREDQGRGGSGASLMRLSRLVCASFLSMMQPFLPMAACSGYLFHSGESLSFCIIPPILHCARKFSFSFPWAAAVSNDLSNPP